MDSNWILNYLWAWKHRYTTKTPGKSKRIKYLHVYFSFFSFEASDGNILFLSPSGHLSNYICVTVTSIYIMKKKKIKKKSSLLNSFRNILKMQAEHTITWQLLTMTPRVQHINIYCVKLTPFPEGPNFCSFKNSSTVNGLTWPFSLWNKQPGKNNK